jgi:hypothetical protein
MLLPIFLTLVRFLYQPQSLLQMNDALRCFIGLSTSIRLFTYLMAKTGGSPLTLNKHT